jgi:hypothetical protein
MKFQVIAIPLIGVELPNGKVLKFGMTREECFGCVEQTPEDSNRGYETEFSCDYYGEEFPLVLEFAPDGRLAGVIADKERTSVFVHSRDVLSTPYTNLLNWLSVLDSMALPERYEGINSALLGLAFWTPEEDDLNPDYVPNTVKMYSPEFSA